MECAAPWHPHTRPGWKKAAVKPSTARSQASLPHNASLARFLSPTRSPKGHALPEQEELVVVGGVEQRAGQARRLPQLGAHWTERQQRAAAAEAAVGQSRKSYALVPSPLATHMHTCAPTPPHASPPSSTRSRMRGTAMKSVGRSAATSSISSFTLPCGMGGGWGGGGGGGGGRLVGGVQ